MIHTVLTVGGKEYKLRITGASMLDIEDKLGKNPLSVFTDYNGTGEMPRMRDLFVIFWGALTPLNTGITLKDAANIYTEYIDDGHEFSEFMEVLVDIFVVSGYMKRDTAEETAEKN